MAASMDMLQCLLPEPPYVRLKHTLKRRLKIHLDVVSVTIRSFSATQKLHGLLLSETKLLHAMIFKRGAQLRNEKTIQLSKRVLSCLRRVPLFDPLFRLTAAISSDLQESLQNEGEDSALYLPVQQVWAYVLYLASKYVELLNGTLAYCVTAFEHVSCQFTTGILIPQMMIFMGIISRVWQACRILSERLSEFYSRIHPMLDCIKKSETSWGMPELPMQLEITRYEVATFERITGQKLPDLITDEPLPSSVPDISEDLGIPVAKKRKREEQVDENRNIKKRKMAETGNKNKEKRKKKLKQTKLSPTPHLINIDANAGNAKSDKTKKTKKKKKSNTKSKISADLPSARSRKTNTKFESQLTVKSTMHVREKKSKKKKKMLSL